MKEERVAADAHFGPWAKAFSGPESTLPDLFPAMHLSFLITYAQGISLLEAASVEHGMDIDVAQSAKVWRAGCIIRSNLLELIRQAVADKPSGQSILMSDGSRGRYRRIRAGRPAALGDADGGLARCPPPASARVSAYLTAYRSATLPANLTQGMRDYFGAHTLRAGR